MRRMWWLAIPALALACATTNGPSSEKMSDTARAQNQAQSEFQRAADAQKRAQEEQQKAEKAQSEVTGAQKALADAQAKLQGQRAKAEQAQQEAAQLAREAQRQGQTAQAQAGELQQSEALQHQQMQKENQQAWMQTRNVRGQAVSASGSELMLRSSDQGDLRLKVNDTTAVKVDGQTGSLGQIRPGSDVRASYQVVDGQPTALRIDARSLSGGTGPSPDASTSGPDNSGSSSQQQPR